MTRQRVLDLIRPYRLTAVLVVFTVIILFAVADTAGTKAAIICGVCLIVLWCLGHLRPHSASTVPRVLVLAGPGRGDIQQAVVKALQDAGVHHPDGKPVVVEFGPAAFFQFIHAGEPGWIWSEVAGPKSRGKDFVPSHAYLQRLAASGWTSEDQREQGQVNHAQAWDLREVTLDMVVNETMTLAFDLYGYDGQGVRIEKVQ